MQGQPHFEGLTEAVARYLDLMFDCDTSRFDQVFRSSAQLHGFRDGQMVVWSAETYKEVLNKRASPKSLQATRADEILLVDFASATQALVKVRVKIATLVFVDYLTWHCFDGEWLITSKGFHLESQTKNPTEACPPNADARAPAISTVQAAAAAALLPRSLRSR